MNRPCPSLLLLFLAGVWTCSCSGGHTPPATPAELPTAEAKPTLRVESPRVRFHHTLGGLEGKAWLDITPAAHPLGSPVTHTSVRWTVDGETTVTTDTIVTVRMELDLRIYQDAREESRPVGAEVTVRYADGVSATTSLSGEIPLSSGCFAYTDYYEGRRWFTDCNRRNVFSIPQTPAFAPTAIASAGESNVVGEWGSEIHKRFSNFVDLWLKRATDPDTGTPVDYNPATYAYRPVTSPIGPYTGPFAVIGQGGYEREPLVERVCYDIPLHGSACIHGYLFDVDGDPTIRFFDYAPTNATVHVTDVTSESMDVVVWLPQVWYDMLYEPPHDVYDLPATAPDYIAEKDLSAYAKAYGKKDGFDLAIRFRVYADSPDQWVLIAVSEAFVISSPYFSYSSSFNPFVGMKLGPFCNSNLATVKGLSPFADMVSDTVSGEAYGELLTTFTAKVTYPYPHTASSEYGGSGVGRDALGLYASPFSYGQSDNAFNCMRPADACTVAGEQDGGLDWEGVSEDCEYPNVSNDGDDATFRTSNAVVRVWTSYLH